MSKIYLYLCFMILFSSVIGDEIRLLYGEKSISPQTQYQTALVNHVKSSVEKALRLESKLSGKNFEETQISKNWRSETLPDYHPLSSITKYPGYHLLNNICSLPDAAHLHVGLLAGDSFISSLYKNQTTLKKQIGIDWFEECSKEIFYANCDQFLIPGSYEIVDDSCFKFDKSIFKTPIDIYFYDADHSLKGHERAITYFNDIFAETFIIIIDDWECPWVRGPTFKAFDKLGYSILYENVILNNTKYDNGQYIAVIKKSSSLVEDCQDDELLKNLELANLKKHVFSKITKSWCSEQKANLIMEVIFKSRPKVCVEVGSFTGSSFLPIVTALSLLGEGQAFAIDAWSNLEAVKGIPPTDPHYTWWLTVDMRAVYKSYLNTMSDARLSPFYTTIRELSSEAVFNFDKIDFLHLDGNFSGKGSLEDAVLYLPRVVSGGYILLSNLFLKIDKQFPKMSSLDMFLEQCEVVAQVDDHQTVLFQKY